MAKSFKIKDDEYWAGEAKRKIDHLLRGESIMITRVN